MIFLSFIILNIISGVIGGEIEGEWGSYYSIFISIDNINNREGVLLIKGDYKINFVNWFITISNRLKIK